MGDSDRSSHDDGELTDDSSQKKPVAPPKHKRISPPRDYSSPERKDIKSKAKQAEEDEETKLRRKLINKIHKKKGDSEGEEEMFTIQPIDLNRAREKEKEREREREKREREKSSRQAHSERRNDRSSGREERDRLRGSERSGGRHELERHGSRKDVSSKPKHVHRDTSEREHKRDRERTERDREREKPRSEREKRKHRSPSSSDEERIKKRERKTSGSKESKKDRDSRKLKEREERKGSDSGAKSENSMDVDVKDLKEVDDAIDTSGGETAEKKAELSDMDDKKEVKITAFTLDSPPGPKKYSKFESSPEPYSDDTPVHSGLEDDDQDLDEPIDVMQSFDPHSDNIYYEKLTAEQKAMLTPDTKKRLEDDWQQRLRNKLPVYYPGIMGCRTVEEFHCVNRIEEGTYGVVYRAKDKRTDEIVALKRLKMEKEKEGFPITTIREINMLLKCGNHPNIVNVFEVVVGSSLDRVFVAMEFVEHDMKSLMDTMSQQKKQFSIGERKTLMIQLISGLKHMHDLWILHRDLKSSNLLLSHKGILKIADFGLAREFGSPLKAYTSVVVTLWYRSPELLLGQKIYSTAVDMWSVGCLMAEFHQLKPLFQGKGEADQINKIFFELGTPTEALWPDYPKLPGLKYFSLPQYPYMQLRKKFPASMINETGFSLLKSMLRYDPERRISAAEALDDEWFKEDPRPTPPEMFPTFPAKSEQHKAPPKARKPQAKTEVMDPHKAKLLAELNVKPDQVSKSGFQLKFDPTTF